MNKSASLLMPLVALGLVTSLAHVAQAQPIFLQSLAISDNSSNTGDMQSTVPSTGASSGPPSGVGRFYLGPSIGTFFPTSSKTSSTYGKTWLSYGIGIGSSYVATAHGELSPYIDILENYHDNNSALVVPLGVAYRKAFINAPTAPYFTIDGFAVGVDQDAPADNVHYGLNVGAGGKVALGLEFSNAAFIEAGYMETTTVKSFDFSGTEIEAGLRFAL